MRMKLMQALSISMLFLFSAANLAAKSKNADSGFYAGTEIEHDLTVKQQVFVRPGLTLDILDVVIPSDRKTEVTYSISDSAGVPLDRNGVSTPGPVSTSFVLSFVPEYEEAYVAYTTRVQTSPITGDSAIQASSDSGGSYTELSVGTYRYKFGTVLPENYDTDATHTLGVYAVRALAEYELSNYVANELDHFVPSGNGEPQPRDIVKTETCNGRCHDPLALHGGSRQDVGLCILCHNPRQGIDPDTGNSVDMPLMIHKIHMGAQLTNGYNIIGYRQQNHDYGEVLYPAPINACEDCHTGGIPTASFPLVAEPNPVPVCDGTGLGSTLISWGDIGPFEIRLNAADGQLFASGSGTVGSQETGKWVQDGTIFYLNDSASGETIQKLTVNTTVFGCVANAPGTPRGEAGIQHTNWMDHPSRKTCGSCHDYIDWETGEGHSDYNLVMADDITCNHCHQPYTGNEFDYSVQGSHLELYKSAQFPGVLVDLIEVTDTNPGDQPTVRFSVRSKNAPIDPASMNRLRFTLSGPNEDYSFLAQETVGDSAIWTGEDSIYTYTFDTPLPLDAAGSFTVSSEGRNIIAINMGGETSDERDNGENPLLAFAVTDTTAVPRRKVVDDYNCESCHSNLAFHGGGRHDPDYCNTCHMPEATDRNDEQTIHFKYMIHSIHRGKDLANGFAIGNHDYSDVVYPGDLRNCNGCHVNNSQQIPVNSGLLSTITPQLWWNPMPPNSAACLSCHDDDASAAHAFSNTAIFGEACGICHAEGRSVSVDKVHAK